ncbi:MAG: hypothetical protein J6W64_09175 [Bacilli bacterium]|nr:hypothetical protein [Bacilli bacterium]MBO7712731.1 hypothetical protein [Methanobrevibacter sp.]MBO7712789.1 hypothetical protein [Methanobrevibacter sp.]
MQKIDGTTIKLNRGDVLKLSVSLIYDDGTSYTFKDGDTLVFSLYNKGKMTDDTVLMKQVVATGGEESLVINFTNEETKLGDPINKEKEYWYEVELNNEHTVIGYDDEGAKILMLYPEGSKHD